MSKQGKYFQQIILMISQNSCFSQCSSQQQMHQIRTLDALFNKNIVNTKNCFEIQTGQINSQQLNLNAGKNWEKISKYISSNSKIYSMKMQNCETNVENIVVSLEEINRPRKKKHNTQTCFNKKIETIDNQITKSDKKNYYHNSSTNSHLDMSLRKAQLSIQTKEMLPMSYFQQRKPGFFLTSLQLQDDFTFQASLLCESTLNPYNLNFDPVDLKSFQNFSVKKLQFFDQFHQLCQNTRKFVSQKDNSLSNFRNQKNIETSQIKHPGSESDMFVLDNGFDEIMNVEEQIVNQDKTVSADIMDILQTPAYKTRKVRNQVLKTETTKQAKRILRKKQNRQSSGRQNRINFYERIDFEKYIAKRKPFNLQKVLKNAKEFIQERFCSKLLCNDFIDDAEDNKAQNAFKYQEGTRFGKLWYSASNSLNFKQSCQLGVTYQGMQNFEVEDGRIDDNKTGDQKYRSGYRGGQKNEYISDRFVGLIVDKRIDLVSALQFDYCQEDDFISKRICSLVHFCNKKQIEIDVGQLERMIN